MDTKTNNLAPTRKPQASRLCVAPISTSGHYSKEARMLITRKPEESLEQYKKRLIMEVEFLRISAEDAFDCYEEAYMNEEAI